MWGIGLRRRVLNSQRPLVWYNPAHWFLIGREWVAGPFIKLTKPFNPVKPQSLNEDDQAFENHNKDVTEHCADDAEGCKERKFYCEVCQVQSPDSKIRQRITPRTNESFHNMETSFAVSHECYRDEDRCYHKWILEQY